MFNNQVQQAEKPTVLGNIPSVANVGFSVFFPFPHTSRRPPWFNERSTALRGKHRLSPHHKGNRRRDRMRFSQSGYRILINLKCERHTAVPLCATHPLPICPPAPSLSAGQ